MALAVHRSFSPYIKMYGKKWPSPIGTWDTFSTRKVLSDGGDEVQYQRFCLIFDVDWASSIQRYTSNSYLLALLWVTHPMWHSLFCHNGRIVRIWLTFVCTPFRNSLNQSALPLSQTTKTKNCFYTQLHCSVSFCSIFPFLLIIHHF